MTRDVVACIEKFNRDRNAERVARKFGKMRASPFAFFRGSCHLFYQDWPKTAELNRAPQVWVTGDLHLENFGAFKGGNRLAYFDLNDFDEGTLAPATWELARFLTSVHLAVSELGLGTRIAKMLCEDFIAEYRAVLKTGKAQWIERATATGVIRTLLDDSINRTRPAFLDHRTALQGTRRKIICSEDHAQPIAKATRRQIDQLMEEIGERSGRGKFFKVIDATTRIAGTGSLGVDRYVVLVRGKGSPDRNVLLDLKESRPSSLVERLGGAAHPWKNQARRVIGIQERMQAVSPAFLSPVKMGGKSFVLRELQPMEDRVVLETLSGEAQFCELIEGMARIVGWAQLRSSGRDGSATADELIAFGTSAKWVAPLLKRSAAYKKTVERDWKQFCAAR